jgi:hypothetical protein
MFLDALQLLPMHEGIVYRGIHGVSLHTIFKMGEKVRVWELMSTSKLRSVAEAFARKGSKPQQTLFEIETKSVAFLGGYSKYPDEQECIFPPGSAFKVVGLEKNGALTIIKLKHISEVINKLYES